MICNSTHILLACNNIMTLMIYVSSCKIYNSPHLWFQKDELYVISDGGDVLVFEFIVFILPIFMIFQPYNLSFCQEDRRLYSVQSSLRVTFICGKMTIQRLTVRSVGRSWITFRLNVWSFELTKIIGITVLCEYPNHPG